MVNNMKFFENLGKHFELFMRDKPSLEKEEKERLKEKKKMAKKVNIRKVSTSIMEEE